MHPIKAQKSLLLGLCQKKIQSFFEVEKHFLVRKISQGKKHIKRIRKQFFDKNQQNPD